MNKLTKYITLILFLTSCYFIKADLAELEEYELKGLYIEKFTRFIKWPALIENEFTKTEFIIGVYGDKKLVEKWTNTFKNQPIKSTKVKIKLLNKIDDVASVNILFIPQGYTKYFQSILDYTKNKPILIIGETKNFAEYGGMINIFTINNLMKFEINLNAANSVGIKISSSLLERAVKVYK